MKINTTPSAVIVHVPGRLSFLAFITGNNNETLCITDSENYDYTFSRPKLKDIPTGYEFYEERENKVWTLELLYKQIEQ